MPTHKPIPPPLPYTLYVEDIDFHPEPDFRIERRKTAIDVEMGKDKVTKLIEQLTKITEKDLPGAVRIRFIGRVFV